MKACCWRQDVPKEGVEVFIVGYTPRTVRDVSVVDNYEDRPGKTVYGPLPRVTFSATPTLWTHACHPYNKIVKARRGHPSAEQRPMPSYPQHHRTHGCP